MTKQDFELIANVILYVDIEKADRWLIAVSFADRLAKENKRFDRPKFLKACGIPDATAKLL